MKEKIYVYLIGTAGSGKSTLTHNFDRWMELRGLDAITVNPYMGFDSLEPFLKYGDKGIFILCLTSNPGSFDFQKIKDEKGVPLYIKVAEKIKNWNKYKNCCAVVGATHPEELKEIREICRITSSSTRTASNSLAVPASQILSMPSRSTDAILFPSGLHFPSPSRAG